MIKKCIFLCLVAVLLSSCSERDDFQYLTTHPKFLEHLVQTCATESATTTKQASTCNTAQQARQEVARLLHTLMASPQQFGKEIIAKQQKLAVLKEDYKKNPSVANAKKIKQQQKLIARYLAVSKFAGE